MLREAVSKGLSWRLKRIAAKAGGERFRLFGVGVFLGGCFQSGTAAILLGGTMAVQGALNTAQGLALALGADVGSTLAAQLLGFDLFIIAPPLFLVAYLVMRFSSGEAGRRTAHAIFGLALIVVSLKGLSVSTEPLRDSEAARQVFSALQDEALILVLLSALLTLFLYSSLAAVLLVMTLAANQLIGLEAAFWMTLGVNLGGGLPPIIASLGEPVEVRRITLGNALFRLLGVLLLAPLAPLFVLWFNDLGLSSARAVVHFHTFVNLAMAAAFLILTPATGRWLERAMRHVSGDGEWRRVYYLNDSTGGASVQAGQILTNATREALRMGDLVSRMLDSSARLIKSDDARRRAEIKELDDAVDFLNREIKLYTTKLEENVMSEQEIRRANLILSTITHLEHIGDIIDTGMHSITRRMRNRRVRFSTDGIQEIRGIHDLVRENLRATLGLLVSPDFAVAGHLYKARLEVNRRCAQTFENHLARLRRGRSESVESSSMHLDLVRDLKRVNDHIAEMADSILRLAGENGTSQP